jgi:hypothetical protein
VPTFGALYLVFSKLFRRAWRRSNRLSAKPLVRPRRAPTAVFGPDHRFGTRQLAFQHRPIDLLHTLAASHGKRGSASPAASPSCMRTGSVRREPYATCVADKQTGTRRLSQSSGLGRSAP